MRTYVVLPRIKMSNAFPADFFSFFCAYVKLKLKSSPLLQLQYAPYRTAAAVQPYRTKKTHIVPGRVQRTGRWKEQGGNRDAQRDFWSSSVLFVISLWCRWSVGGLQSASEVEAPAFHLACPAYSVGRGIISRVMHSSDEERLIETRGKRGPAKPLHSTLMSIVIA